MTINWDRASPHTVAIQVQRDDIDELGHANNTAYVRWMEHCAWQHSQSLGLNLASYRELDRAMVVLRHEIDYLASAYLDDELVMGTWIVETDGKLRLIRHFQLLRKSDGVTLLRARSTFVCISLSSARPKRMPEAFVLGYGGALVQECT